MNHLTRRFASSSAHTIQKLKLQATANSGTITTLRFPTSAEEKNRNQHRRFSSIISNYGGSPISSVGAELPVVTSMLSSVSIGRPLSTNTTAETSDDKNTNDSQEEDKQQQILSPTSPTVFTDNESGEKYGVILDTRKLPKLKPSIVRKRLDNCRTYVGREKSIRQSPWKLNRICQLAAGLTLEEALTQLKFCDLKNADLVAKVLKRTSNLADIRDGLQISQLEVKECFSTKSLMLRRIKTMGRGR